MPSCCLPVTRLATRLLQNPSARYSRLVDPILNKDVDYSECTPSECKMTERLVSARLRLRATRVVGCAALDAAVGSRYLTERLGFAWVA